MTESRRASTTLSAPAATTLSAPASTPLSAQDFGLLLSNEARQVGEDQRGTLAAG